MSFVALAVLTACSTSPTPGARQWQDALDRASLSLADAVTVAEADGAKARKAELRVDGGGVFSVTALEADVFDDIRVDIESGSILSRQATSFSADDCSGAISLAETIAAAEEQEPDGQAVSAGPDDDGHCNTEVIVLSGDTLWEVKIGPSGELVEDPEKADDDEGPDGSEA